MPEAGPEKMLLHSVTGPYPRSGIDLEGRRWAEYRTDQGSWNCLGVVCSRCSRELDAGWECEATGQLLCPGHVEEYRFVFRTPQPAVAMARVIAGASDWSALPILADVLEDFGCTDAVMLGALRHPDHYYPDGGWAFRLLLAQSSPA